MSHFSWKDVQLLYQVAAAVEEQEDLSAGLRRMALKLGMLLEASESGSKSESTEGARVAFRSKLKKLRKEKGVTQRELAEEIGLSKNAIYLYEAGKNVPNFETFVDLCLALEVSPDKLLGFAVDEDAIERTTVALEILDRGNEGSE